MIIIIKIGRMILQINISLKRDTVISTPISSNGDDTHAVWERNMRAYQEDSERKKAIAKIEEEEAKRALNRRNKGQ